jgi:hypothetical protein
VRVVLLGEFAEAGEEVVVVLQGAVPGEDDELRRLLARLELSGYELVRLRSGVGGRTVPEDTGFGFVRP